MNGKELYKKYTSRRDFSGKPEDVYAQLLNTLLFNVGDDLYDLLEKAESSGQKIEITNDNVDFVSINDLTII